MVAQRSYRTKQAGLADDLSECIRLKGVLKAHPYIHLESYWHVA